MKRSLFLISLLVAIALTSAAKTADQLRIYVNPGHGAWTSNDRPLTVIREDNPGEITVHKPNVETTYPDTTAFFETNTNLRKCLAIVDKLESYGLQIDRTKNQTGNNPARIGAALDLSNNICMSHVKAGSYGNNVASGNYNGGGKYNRKLTEIADEADCNNFDMFISVHSNGQTEGAQQNYLLYLYRGTDATEQVAGSKNMIAANKPRLYNVGHNKWTSYTSTQGQTAGDWSFYGESKIWSHTNSGNGKTYKGYLGVMMHGVPGFLAEGYFHTYQPARQRAMNFDVDRMEGYQYARGIADYFGLTKESTGDIYGIVRDNTTSFIHEYYSNPNSTDSKMPVNYCTVILKRNGVEVDRYVTDNNFNGAFVFADIPTGTYTIDIEKDGYFTSTGNEVTVTAATTTYPELYITPYQTVSYSNAVQEAPDTTPAIYITGKQMSGHALNASSDTPYLSENVERFEYDADNHCYHFTFTAGSSNLDNSFSMSTQVGSYYIWDQYGVVIDWKLYAPEYTGAHMSYSGSPNYIGSFELDRKYMLNHDHSCGEGARAATGMTPGQRYTIYIKGDFKSYFLLNADYDSNTNTIDQKHDSNYKKWMWVSAGEYDPAQGADKLYIQGSIIGSADSYSGSSDSLRPATDLLYAEENVQEFTYDPRTETWHFDFTPTTTSVKFTTSRFAHAIDATADATFSSRISTLSTNIGSGFRSLKSGDFYYNIWDYNAKGIARSITNNGSISIGTRYAMTLQEEALRTITGLTAGTPYRITVGKNLDWLEVNAYDPYPEGKLYVLGGIAGTTLNQSSDYKASNAKEFAGGTGADDPFHYTFTARSGANANSFTLSRAVAETNNYSVWDSHGLRTNNGSYSTFTGTGQYASDRTPDTFYGSNNVKLGVRYPLIETEGTRYVTTNEGNYPLVAGETYTMYVEYDYSAMWIVPGTYYETSDSKETLYLVGKMNEAGYDFGGYHVLTTEIKAPMALMKKEADGTYTYRATSGLDKYFAVLNKPKCVETNLISTMESSSTPLLLDGTAYAVFHDPDKGKQKLSHSATGDVTLTVGAVTDPDNNVTSRVYGYLTITDNEQTRPMFAKVDGGTITAMTHSSGVYSLPLSDNSVAGTTVAISRYKPAEIDASVTGADAFGYGQLAFESPTLNVGGEVDEVSQSATGAASTLTLGRHFQAQLSVAPYAYPAVASLSGNDEASLYILGGLVGTGLDKTADYKIGVAKKFSYDSDNDLFHHTFTYSASTGATFTLSKVAASGASDYNYWNANGLRTDKESRTGTTYKNEHGGTLTASTNVLLGVRYPLLNDEEGPRIATTNTGNYELTNGGTYTMYVDGNYTSVWILPGDYEPGCENTIYLMGAINGANFTLTEHLNSGMKFDSPRAMMKYDAATGSYSYNATTALNSNFLLLKSEEAIPTNILSTNFISSTALAVDGSKIMLFNDPERGRQVLNHSASGDLTIYVTDIDPTATAATDRYGYLYVRDNALSHQPLFFDVDGNITGSSWASGSFTLQIGNNLGGDKVLRLSQYNNSGNDGISDTDAFFTGIITFAKGTIAMGETVAINRTAGQLHAPAREGATDTPSTTLQLGACYNASVTVVYDEATGTGTVTLNGQPRPNLYITGNTVGGWIYTEQSQVKEFSWNSEGNYYYYSVGKQTLSSAAKFTISTENPGNKTQWYQTAFRISGNPSMIDGTRYDLVATTAIDQDITIDDPKGVLKYKEYDICVSADLTKVWLQPKLWINGWLTGGYSYLPGGRDKKDSDNKQHEFATPMTYDPVNEYYTYQTAGAKYSVFELSTVLDLNYDNGWLNGMLYHTMETQQAIKPISALEPDNVDPADYADENRHYVCHRGVGGSTLAEQQKGDMTIEGYQPNYVYTVYVSADLEHFWVTELPVNMPLTAEDFRGTTADGYPYNIPHYFLVGTRTADWRLLPEWELKVNADRTKASLKNRFMYDGFFGFARVDTYYDYVRHKYTLFGNADAAFQNFDGTNGSGKVTRYDTQTGKPYYELPAITLNSGSESGALHYTPDDPEHSIGNSITWNLDSGEDGYADPDQHGNPTADMMKRSIPWRIKELTIDISNLGNIDHWEGSTPYPPQESISIAKFAGANDYETLNSHRTFSLVGSDINYEQPYEFAEPLMGTRDLRDMGPTASAAGQRNWANTWISYDATGEPYYDAYTNTLYLTAYDYEWISTHDVMFDMKVGSNYMTYNSENTFFRAVEDLDMSDDEYSWLYQIHDKDFGAEMKMGEYIVDANLEDGNHYRYLEKLLTGYGNVAAGTIDPANPVYGTWDLDNNTQYTGWKAYVLKDVWLKGNFKVWSGWGGNLWSTEGWDASSSIETGGEVPGAHDRQRWYYGNFGHSIANNNYPVVGSDVLTTATMEDATDNMKVIYQTRRDVDRAYFQVEGSNDTDNENVEPQYYKRVILWYNVDKGVKYANETNGVLQFIQESLAPTIRAYRQDGTGNKFYVRWKFEDHSGIEAHSNWNVTQYTIKRYRMVYDSERETDVEQLYRQFDTQALSGVTVGDLFSGTREFYDPYILPTGTYFYRIEAKIQDPATGVTRTKIATSNMVKVAAASKPVIVDAEQVIEDGKYSFNVKLTTQFNPDHRVLTQTSHYLNAVFEDMDKLVITADKETAQRLNAAKRVELRSHNGKGLTVYQPGDGYRANVNWGKTDPIGFGKVNGYQTGLIYNVENCGPHVKFIPDGEDEETWSITFTFNQLYHNSNTDKFGSYYFREARDIMEYIGCPEIIWHNVEPTEGVEVGDNLDHQYKFKATAKSVDNNNDGINDYDELWTNSLGLVPDNASTHVYAPDAQLKRSNTTLPIVLEKSDLTIDHSNITDHSKMVPGALHNGEKAYPVQYPKVNETALGVTLDLPVTDEVFTDMDVLVKLEMGNSDEEKTDIALTDSKTRGRLRSIPFGTTTVADDEHSAAHGSTYHNAPESVILSPKTVTVYTNKEVAEKEFTTSERVIDETVVNISMPTATVYAPDVLPVVRYKNWVNEQWCYTAFATARISWSGISHDDLYYYPGFHLVNPNGGEGSDHYPLDDDLRKDHGGQPYAENDKEEGGWMNRFADFYNFDDYPHNGYRHLGKNEDYDNDVHNWSHLAATGEETLTLLLDRIYTADNTDDSNSSWASLVNNGQVTGSLYFIIPVAETGLRFESSTPSGAPQQANGNRAPRATTVAFDNLRVLGTKADIASHFDDGQVTNLALPEVDEGEAVYYNLQGIRVLNPRAGEVYIVVTPRGVSKQVRF